MWVVCQMLLNSWFFLCNFTWLNKNYNIIHLFDLQYQAHIAVEMFCTWHAFTLLVSDQYHLSDQFTHLLLYVPEYNGIPIIKQRYLFLILYQSNNYFVCMQHACWQCWYNKQVIATVHIWICEWVHFHPLTRYRLLNILFQIAKWHTFVKKTLTHKLFILNLSPLRIFIHCTYMYFAKI